MKVKGIGAVKETKELDELASPGGVAGGGIENSRRMISYEYNICPDKSERSWNELEVIGGTGVGGGVSLRRPTLFRRDRNQ
jgi:hypothetical protein